MMIRPYIPYTLIILGFLSFPLHAHAVAADSRIELPSEPSERIPTPEEFQKGWIINNCAKGTQVMRFSRYFHMRSMGNESRITRTEGVVPMERNTYQVSMPRNVSRIAVKKNGDLLQFYPRPGDSPTIAAVESGRALASFFKFKYCPGSENGFVSEDKRKLSLLPRLDRMHEACPKRNDLLNESCQSAVFDLFDLNGDHKVNINEMNDAWQIVGIYHGGAGASCEVPPALNTAGNTSTPAPAATAIPAASSSPVTLADGMPYFEWLIKNLDQDNDQALSYNEVRGQWDRMNKDSLMTAFILTLTTAEGKLRYLPQPADAPQ